MDHSVYGVTLSECGAKAFVDCGEQAIGFRALLAFTIADILRLMFF